MRAFGCASGGLVRTPIEGPRPTRRIPLSPGDAPSADAPAAPTAHPHPPLSPPPPPAAAARPPQELARRTLAGEPLYPLDALAGTPLSHCDGAVPCSFFHPGQTCGQHALSIFPHNYQRALRVYLPVYLLPMVLVHRQRLLKDPLPILNKAAFGIARCAPGGPRAPLGAGHRRLPLPSRHWPLRRT
jgi:hypothetical protein